jgi:hypothetical protein
VRRARELRVAERGAVLRPGVAGPPRCAYGDVWWCGARSHTGARECSAARHDVAFRRDFHSDCHCLTANNFEKLN